MKIFIWLLCFFLFIFTQVILKNTGYTIGGIPMLILCSSFYYLAKGLCKAWDNLCRFKQSSQCKIRDIHIPAIKIKPLILALVLLVVTSVALCVYSNIQYKKQIAHLNEQISQMVTAQELLESELEEAYKSAEHFKNLYGEDHLRNYDLTKDNEKMKLIYDYCEKNMVFVISQTQQYHKGHCFMIQDSSSSFDGYTIASAQQRGYTPCWLCCNT